MAKATKKAGKVETAWVAVWIGEHHLRLTSGYWIMQTRRDLLDVIRRDAGITGAKNWKPVRVEIREAAKGKVKHGK